MKIVFISLTELTVFPGIVSAETIQGWNLFADIRYIGNVPKKIGVIKKCLLQKFFSKSQ